MVVGGVQVCGTQADLAVWNFIESIESIVPLNIEPIQLTFHVYPFQQHFILFDLIALSGRHCWIV
jgi:hypothetical protein